MTLNSLGLRLEADKLFILDQELLPHEEKWILVEGPDHMVQLIKSLKVRGAPLIGVAAVLSLAHYGQREQNALAIKNAAEKLRQARPTAVNLMVAIDRMLQAFKNQENLMQKAQELFHEDVQMCQGMAQSGASLIQDGDQILTHCNSGGLATVGLGTALGVILQAHLDGKKIHVWVDETRPLLQGGRLTTWELQKFKVPHTLICDNMAGSLMGAAKIQKIFTGADRVALNGDFANKIGTYSVAVLAQYHNIPFYPVAPLTTIDFAAKSGKDIPVEMRGEQEVRGYRQTIWAPPSPTHNPAFDVTPVSLVTGLVTDHGYFSQADLKNQKLKGLENELL